MTTHSPRAVCLVSGGMDSAVTLAEAKAAGFEAFALSFRYGQRHEVELACAKRVTEAAGVRDHRIVDLNLSALGGSALTADIDVPKDRDFKGDGTGGVPITYVPARNTVFLSVALGWAEILGAQHIYLGVNAVDYSGYPDCRPEFLEAFEALANLATAAATEDGVRFKVVAPLLHSTKAKIVQRAAELGVDLGLTHTCYDPVIEGPRALACGRCDACVLRLQGFSDAGAVDPIAYAIAPGI
jgi:7-cyano-7-deazaguanine synthase